MKNNLSLQIKYAIVFALILLRTATCPAQNSDFFTTLSPKLIQFLRENRNASNQLSKYVGSFFKDRKIQLYYFYSQNETAACAFHYYAANNDIVIGLRENQNVFDEYILLSFEMVNSTHEKRFENLMGKARAGSISKTNFAVEMLKTEFDAVKSIRDYLLEAKYPTNLTETSSYFKQFTECPTNFEGFLVFTKRLSSPVRDPIREYEQKYDYLRGTN